MQKKWQVAEAVDKNFRDNFPELDPVILQLLYNRRISTQEKIDEFLNPDYSSDLHDPFLFNHMDKAVKRVMAAVEKKEKIYVYGDYDADGVCASTILVAALKALGADVDVYIPFRETEGYGLNFEALKFLLEQKLKLLITVDCGVTGADEVSFLTKNGVDTIITDHHEEPPALPKALAIINPSLSKEKYPFKRLAGCGVAYKFVQGLLKEHSHYPVNQLAEGWEKWLLDLAAIGTITDLMPLVGENRALVKYGLVVLRKTKRLGLKAIFDVMGSNLTEIDERVVGFQLGPRLNAAGRLNHANASYEILSTTESALAKKLAQELESTNQQRQKVTEMITGEVLSQIGETSAAKILSAVGNGWPTGIIGLVAGRLTDKFYRPSLVISRFGGQIVGSGRSIIEFDVTKALQECGKYLNKFGGHAQACGFTIKNEESIQPFIEKMQSLASQKFENKDLKPSLNIDAEVAMEGINWELYEQIQSFTPFGVDNPKPLLLAKQLIIEEAANVGQDKKHLKLIVSHQGNQRKKLIGFCLGEWCQLLKKNDKVDVVFELGVNEWNNNRELQIKIIDLKVNND